jgi:NitT/TauT family transport system ATP-binding protein
MHSAAVAGHGSATAAVEIDRVTKVYPTRSGYVHALAEISLDIREHEFVSLLGPSGCGKSTLLLLASGLVPNSGGTIRIHGHTVSGPYKDLGIVFQRDALLNWRTAVDNVLLQTEIRHLPKLSSQARAMALLEEVGLGGFEHSYPRELSGGMRQRVSLCRALIHEPPLLFMDEPFGALDALTRDQLGLDLLRIWERDRKTVIFVTHSIPEAVFLSDRVVVMSPRPGRVELDLAIHLPRPRTLAMTESSEFSTYTRQIHDIFRAIGVLAEGPRAPRQMQPQP